MTQSGSLLGLLLGVVDLVVVTGTVVTGTVVTGTAVVTGRVTAAHGRGTARRNCLAISSSGRLLERLLPISSSSLTVIGS